MKNTEWYTFRHGNQKVLEGRLEEVIEMLLSIKMEAALLNYKDVFISIDTEINHDYGDEEIVIEIVGNRTSK